MTDTTQSDRPREPIGLEQLKILIERYGDVKDRILRQFLITLHQRGIATVDALYEEAQSQGSGPTRGAPADENPNRPERSPWDDNERTRLDDLVLRKAAATFTTEEAGDLVNLVLKRERARSIEEIATLSNVSTPTVLKALEEFTELPVGGIILNPAEIMGTRVALIRRFITDQLDFIGIAKHFLRVRDLAPILKGMVSSPKRQGRIGGKAAGLLIAKSILHTAMPDDACDFCETVKTPESFFMSSDVHEEFVEFNRLVSFRNQKYKSTEEIRKELPMITQVFRNSTFPPEVVNRLRHVIEEVGTSPLIVRSSSHLEDSYGMAFSGKYRSIFLGNQGSPMKRLSDLLGAVAEVYASIFGPDPISYRRAHHMLDYDERMGILIQKVVGRTHGRYFFPFAAGVAFSHNEHRWSKRIRKEDGLVRLVMGLGTRAVDRTGDDYPRMIALGMPTLRPEMGAEEVLRYSQRWIDAIDIEANRFDSVPNRDALGAWPFAGLEHAISVLEEDHLAELPSVLDALPSGRFAVTFNRFIQEGGFIKTVRAILGKLERAYHCPVDVEFACDDGAFYLLQCRPQARRAEVERVAIPRNVPADRIVFTASKDLPTARVSGIEVIVYVNPVQYDRIASSEEKGRVGRAVGRLNEVLSERSFILMGPGRWGSSNLNLGVRVSYADLSNTKLLVEIAREKEGYTPEVSYGTHFFQDLVEAGIWPLPLYPDQPGVIFNEPFLTRSENSLALLAPDFGDLENVVHVIDLPRVADGKVLDVIMDGEAGEALGFLR